MPSETAQVPSRGRTEEQGTEEGRSSERPVGHSHSARTGTPSYLDIPCWILDILRFSVVWPVGARIPVLGAWSLAGIASCARAQLSNQYFILCQWFPGLETERTRHFRESPRRLSITSTSTREDLFGGEGRSSERPVGHSHSARTGTPSYLDIPCWILDILRFSVVWPVGARIPVLGAWSLAGIASSRTRPAQQSVLHFVPVVPGSGN